MDPRKYNENPENPEKLSVSEIDVAAEIVGTDGKSFEELAGPQKVETQQSLKVKKFKALYQARTVLSLIGSMQERQVSKRMLIRMRKSGIKSV